MDGPRILAAYPDRRKDREPAPAPGPLACPLPAIPAHQDHLPKMVQFTALFANRVRAAKLSGWHRKFVGGQGSGWYPSAARWTVQAVSSAS